MEKDILERLAGISLITVSILVIVVLVVLQLQTLMEAAAEIALIAVGTMTISGLRLVFFPEKSTLEKQPMYNWTDAQLIESAITKKGILYPDLTHLDIRYSRRNDTADKHDRFYVVINTKTKKAYWVRTELLVLNKRTIIHSNTHESEAELREYLKHNGITLIEANPNFGDLYQD